MTKTFSLLFLSTIFSLQLLGQTKIYLVSTKPSGDYAFVNPKDANLIATYYRGDMGVHYDPYYIFKDDDTKIPDGRYEIYVDDKLDLVAFYKNHLKDSIWTETKTYNDTSIVTKTTPYQNGVKHGEEKTVYADSSFFTMPYKQGYKHGLFTSYHPNGQLKIKAMIYEGVMPLRTRYYNNGIISNREFFTKENHKLRHEHFDRNGKLKEIHTFKPRFKIEKFEDAELNGTIEKSYIGGSIIMEYKSNELIKFTMYDQLLNVLYTE